MSNLSEKTASNVFYLARMRAAKHNEALSSREGAADIMAIDRGRLYRIESDVADPYPEEVRMMADLYNEPELCNHYCRKCCPLGRHVPEVKSDNLDRITLKAMYTLKDVYKTRDLLLEIAQDGVIDESEKKDMETVLGSLDDIVQLAEELRAWVKKNL